MGESKCESEKVEKIYKENGNQENTESSGVNITLKQMVRDNRENRRTFKED